MDNVLVYGLSVVGHRMGTENIPCGVGLKDDAKHLEHVGLLFIKDELGIACAGSIINIQNFATSLSSGYRGKG